MSFREQKRAARQFAWNDEQVGQLRIFWDEGHSTAEIGRRIQMSKNAVIGKADRIGLSRPSPLKPKGSGKPAAPVRVRAPSLAELVTLSSLKP